MKLNHRFYLKSKKEQVWIQVKIGLVSFLLLLFIFLICWKYSFFLPLIICIPITLSLIAPFFDVPSLKETGGLVYYSPLFLAEKPKKEKIIIHGGTLFDYFFVIDRKLNGRKRMNFILHQYLEGLVHLIDHLEEENKENLIIRGTSYIINERTAKKLGFKVVQTDFLQKCILVYNYFNLLISYSLAKGKWTWPRIDDTKTFEAKLEDLIERKDYIKSLERKLKNRHLA
ncbi:hypothetical protein FHS59_001434 [Algoriphagus iocasae]|uniref:Uncharacterized protein n=1 Tax=Algoriphagus iocasae TaxID=1836499 RepID=A0A841MKD4_9BACT|nr:hypothetical protein [Algoriphagus iocasae]MBB6325819.1 hypothetical protein [Algoriphagus iocasae]